MERQLKTKILSVIKIAHDIEIALGEVDRGIGGGIKGNKIVG